ncbi:MAG: Tol-Pal system beta propeller repeat protein TolB [Alphaproteobacteria bacterium]|nr:Tol-Pal system beta propeller repeat protein TolB [Alphaproteobacteria bacterium]HCO99949.1 Tol-Pal system protein TolB [Rhodospirillaceae bacterium]
MMTVPSFRSTPALLVVLLLSVLAVLPARAELTVDITQGNIEPLPIAVPDFIAGDDVERKLSIEIAEVISANLQRTGLFRPIDKKAFISQPQSLGVNPRFANWKPLNAQALVVGAVNIEANGALRASFRLWDVFAEGQMTGLSLTTTQANWRRVAHIISDTIYERITGEAGYFDTRIVYISESGPSDRRVKRLAIMDQDGANHRLLTDGKTLVLTPRFSPTQQEITYLAYYNDQPRVYLFNIDTGEQELLGDFPGMTFAPRFSPDGNNVVMSFAKDGNSDIHVMDLRTRRVRRLTDSPSIDTGPSYAPDANKIVFESDRGGSQQLYVMNADGSGQRRISFEKGRYGTPVWSPRGDLIAFTKIFRGTFHIGVMRPDGSDERLLTQGFLVEGPTWAPNGRVLMFFRQEKSDAQGRGGDPRLFSIDLTGFNERELGTPFGGSDPAWSPGPIHQ